MTKSITAMVVTTVLAFATFALAMTRPDILPLLESGAIKTWASGETLTSSDLNANFAHIHSNMVGGHGARLVDADVNASANIASSKLAGNKGIARAWADLHSATCTSGTCTADSSYNVTSVVHAALGSYTVTLGYTATNTNYGVLVTPASNPRTCIIEPTRTTTTFTVSCYQDFASTANDSRFMVVVYDND